MKGFLESIKPSTSVRDKLIKGTLTQRLSESVKEIQMSRSGENLACGGDVDAALCTVLEAIYLHGLKDSLAQAAKRAFGTDVDEKPEPSFWSMLLVFSHRQIIHQIQSLQQITTEVGFCRAWLRVALNDSLLSSYLAAMQRDSHILRRHYSYHAFLRDNELVEITRNLLAGVEACATFSLAINSSLLNYWSSPPLLMAGIWSPPLRSCPISSGLDIARSLEATPTSLGAETTSLFLSTSQNSGLGQYTVMNEQEALKIILSNSSEDNKNGGVIKNIPTNELKDQKSDNIPEIENPTDMKMCKQEISDTECSVERLRESPGIGNSLSGKCGWSFGGRLTIEEDDVLPGSSTDFSEELRKSSETHPLSDASYNALVESYNLVGGAYIKTSDVTATWQQFGCIENSSEKSHHRSKSDDLLLSGLGFEVVPSSASTVFSVNELNMFSMLLGVIAREKGLDNQKYVCGDCGNTLGISFAKPSSVCAFCGDYFCEDCMNQSSFVIPARVIYNWDFRRYPVSNRAATFLTDFKDQPLIDFKLLNPHVYTVLEEMNTLQTLRVQLNFLRAYLYTCREPVIEQLQRRVWPKEYFYECVHQYSISDLENIPNGVLATQLQQVMEFARSHVISCWLCSQKGFICEVCNKPKVLYPFDLENTFRCKDCSAVFHKECLDTSTECPKCERIRKRHLPK